MHPPSSPGPHRSHRSGRAGPPACASPPRAPPVRRPGVPSRRHAAGLRSRLPLVASAANRCDAGLRRVRRTRRAARATRARRPLQPRRLPRRRAGARSRSSARARRLRHDRRRSRSTRRSRVARLPPPARSGWSPSRRRARLGQPRRVLRRSLPCARSGGARARTSTRPRRGATERARDPPPPAPIGRPAAGGAGPPPRRARRGSAERLDSWVAISSAISSARSPARISRPPGDLLVLVGPQRLRQRVVGAVADQRMAERELLLAREARRLVWEDELLHAEAPERVAHLPAIGRPVSVGERADPEDASDHGGVLQDRLLVVRQRRPAAPRSAPGSKRGSSTSVIGLRDLPRDASVARSTPSSISLRTISSTNSGLPSLRSTIARSSSGVDAVRRADRRASPRSRRPTAGPGRSSRRCACRRPRRAASRTARAARSGDDHDRPLRPVGEVVDEVQQPVIGPVDVLEHEHQRVARGHPFEEAAPRLEQVLAAEVAAARPRRRARRSAGRRSSSPNSSRRPASTFSGRDLGRHRRRRSRTAP